MGERLLCKQEVIGSIPFTSTTGEPRLGRGTARDVWRGKEYRTAARLRAGGVLIEG